MTNVFRKEAEAIAVQLGVDEHQDISEAVHMIVSSRAIAFGELCEVHAAMDYGFEVQYAWETGYITILQDTGVLAFAAPCSHPDNSYHVMYYTQG